MSSEENGKRLTIIETDYAGFKGYITGEIDTIKTNQENHLKSHGKVIYILATALLGCALAFIKMAFFTAAAVLPR